MPPDESPTVEDAYDKLAQTYETQEEDPYCADLEFPAMTELIPDREGKRVLDAGCGDRYRENADELEQLATRSDSRST